jgi:hypothetical protein
MIGREQQFQDPANVPLENQIEPDEATRLQALQDAETNRLDDLEKAEKKVAKQADKK